MTEYTRIFSSPLVEPGIGKLFGNTRLGRIMAAIKPHTIFDEALKFYSFDIPSRLQKRPPKCQPLHLVSIQRPQTTIQMYVIDHHARAQKVALMGRLCA